MKKIVVEKIARVDGDYKYHNFHIVTRGGACYGRLYDGCEWAYVHYTAHKSGIDYMVDMPKKDVMALVRGKVNWATFENFCSYWEEDNDGYEV